MSKRCRLTAAYWRTLLDFARATGTKLLFGLGPGDKDSDDSDAVNNVRSLRTF